MAHGDTTRTISSSQFGSKLACGRGDLVWLGMQWVRPGEENLTHLASRQHAGDSEKALGSTHARVSPFKRQTTHPGCCGSVDSVLAYKPKGCWLHSQSLPMPGLQARSPVGDVQEAANCFPRILMFLSLPSPLSKNK